MLKYVIPRGVVVYQGETDEQAFARHEAMVAHNEAVDRAMEQEPPRCAWCGFAAGWHAGWCAPHLRGSVSSDVG